MWIKNVLLCVGVALAALGAQAQTKAPAAGAAATIGYVKTVKGEAFVDSGGQAIKAVEGTPLKVGDVVRTGANGSAGITLKDNTVMSFGPSTRFTLEEYLFAPAKGDLKLGGRLASGSLHYVSGLIAKAKPEAVNVKTPTGTIGVRGTRFVAVVAP
ncbi:MAG: FecR domain-containing protein [Hydrogenophaga sp.]|uniref:FecR family protein n=1 Tax=Hydrogenophaga sp. TaxID=1904254 RepID=UPI0027345F84|nr:FecR domain-containing protein [Hydrogenophaga sp.]MDP3627091.1 FecR domain-containing protein [Hydrogenophaga sp.]